MSAFRKLKMRAHAQLQTFGDLVAVRVIRLLAQDLRQSDAAISTRLTTIETLLRESLHHRRADQ